MERTFHHHASPLHGITVAVDTSGGALWVGRCDDEDAERVILLDADVYPPASGGDGSAGPVGSSGGDEAEGEASLSKEEWLARVARFGVWPRHRRVILPRPEVVELRRLGDVV